MTTTPKGVIVLLIAPEGSICAQGVDFDPFAPAGFTVAEAQEQRARSKLTSDLMKNCCTDDFAACIDPVAVDKTIERMILHMDYRIEIIRTGE